MAFRRLTIAFAAALWLAGCASQTPAPVEESKVVVKRPAKAPALARPAAPARVASPETHQVERGDTLYSIAFRYGLDFRALASWNNIAEPYRIYPGQKLRLRPRKEAAPAVAAATPEPARKPASSAPAATAAASTAVQIPPAVPARLVNGWRWPVQGKLLSGFNANTIGPKGIAIGGNAGDPVHAARDGRVVYTGSSLVGYGQLVIIKHDDVYLSAYAHNDKVLVKEGDSVRAGDVIALMGNSGTDRVQLHFEVRRNGDPIDPLAVLPRP